MVPGSAAKLDDVGVLETGSVAQLAAETILGGERVGHGADALDCDGVGGVDASVDDSACADAELVGWGSGEMDVCSADDEIAVDDGCKIRSVLMLLLVEK